MFFILSQKTGFSLAAIAKMNYSDLQVFIIEKNISISPEIIRDLQKKFPDL